MKLILGKKTTLLIFAVLLLFCGMQSIGYADNTADPHFHGGPLTYEVAENTAAGTNIGNEVQAHNFDTFDQYRLGGTDAASFSLGSPLIDGRIVDAQLKVKAALNFEAKNSYSVTIFADKAIREQAGSPPSLQTIGFEEKDSIDVTINVTNVNDAPAFVADTENISITRYTSVSDVIGTVVATDPDVAGANTDTNPRTDDADALAYSLSGDDAASFAIDDMGQLSINTDLNAAIGDEYMVTVTVVDGDTTDTTTLTDTINVTITVIVTPVCDRTEQVRDAIVAAVGVTDCADVTETHLAAITSLSLFSQSITALKAGDFDGLTALTTLSLNNNQISTLPAGVFDEITALTTLRLDNNQISTLPSGVFDKITALTTLRLSGNQLSMLEEDVFDGLTALTTLRLSGNQLRTLEEDVFDGLTALTTLLLDENRLISLEEDVFDGLTALATLQLTNNKISTLPAGVFEGLTALTTLLLDENRLISLEEEVFEGLTALTTLNLDGNDLTALPADVFEGLTTLSVLRLHKNQISTLPAGVFEGLTALTTLYLNNNIVNPLPLTVSLKQVAEGEFKATAHTGAPFVVVLPVTVTDGTIDGTATTITVPIGNVESGSLTVTRTTGTTAAVTVTIGTLPGLPTNHTGYALTKSSDLPLKVISEPSNNAPEFTDGTETTRLVAENTAAGENIGDPVEATDDDTADILTYRLNGTDADSFDIVSTTGQLQTKAALDRETKSSYSVTVVVTDGNGGINSIAVTINVTEANYAPEFTDGTETTTREVDENTAAGTNIGAAVSATDPNVAGTNTDANPETSTPDTLTYTLSSTTDEPNDYQTFDIDTATGQLKIKDALDYETKTSYKMTVSVSDGTLSDTITVTINITNVNEVPTFPATTDTTLEVTKYTPEGTDIGDPVAATDPDVTSTNTDVNPTDANVDALTYTLGGTDAASFDIDSETGQLKTKTGVTFDRTTQSSYMVTVTASDGEFMTSTPVGITVVVTPVCDRTEQVRDAIVAAVPGVTDCADVTETHLAAIMNLNLSNKSITALKAGDFDGLTALETLNLSRNQISTLTAGVFDELTALTELDLSYNQISTLTAGVFDKITALTHLYLSYNQISTLTAGVFDELTALTRLDLSYNQISTLTAGVFDELTALTALDLSYNQISTLTARVFDELTALTELDLSNNQISTLTARVFDELTALTELDLSNNQISTLTALGATRLV